MSSRPVDFLGPNAHQVQLIQPLAQQAESATEDSWVVLVARRSAPGVGAG